MSTPTGEITQLLEDCNEGDPEALGKLMELVYEELHTMARHYFAKESSSHTLQPTAIVSELCLRLLGQRKVQWHDRAQFFGVSAKLIRRILIDHARKKIAKKRGYMVNGPLPAGFDLAEDQTWDPVTLIALDEALDNLARLGQLGRRQSRIAQLRLVFGLTADEIAAVEKHSRAQVFRDLKTAMTFLKRELSTSSREDDDDE